MKVLFCGVTNEDIYGDDCLDLCVVPLSQAICGRIRTLTKAVSSLAAEVPDLSVAIFEDQTPKWYGTDWVGRYLDEVEEDCFDFELGAGASVCLETSQLEVLYREGFILVDVPETFSWPKESPTDKCFLNHWGSEVRWNVQRHIEDHYASSEVPVALFQQGQDDQ